MKNHYIKTTYFSLVILLAVFGFVFLGTEYLFDDRLALLVDAKEVVLAQGYVLGASVLGYLLYYPVQKIEKNKVLYRTIFVCGGMLYIACVMMIIYGKSYRSILSAGLICFVLLGNLGSAACYCVSRMIPDCRNLARVTGISYAIGIGIQFINNNFVGDFFKQSIVLCVLICVLIGILLFQSKCKITDENTDSDNQFLNAISVRSALLLLTLIVAIFTCVFSTLDNAVTLVHSDGVFNIGQWPRLFLAVSGMLAGFLYDIRDRRYMNMIMYMVAILALISLVIMGFGGSFLIGLTIFYVSAGFFVVYFMTGYMDIARFTGKPALWAGMGRAVNNMVSGLISLSSVTLLLNNMMMTIIVAILLFTVLSCCMMLYQKRYYYDEEMFELSSELSNVRDELRKATITLTEEERMTCFAKKYGLTAREEEIVAVLVRSEDSIQDVARELALSRTALYRHLSSIQEKVGVSSRIGIIRDFYCDEKELGRL